MTSRRRFFVNYRLESSSQGKKKPSVRKVKEATDRFTRLVVTDMMFDASEQTYKDAKSALVRDIKRVIEEEVKRMARQIARGLAQPDNKSGPNYQLTIRNDRLAGPRLSKSATATGLSDALSQQFRDRGWAGDRSWNTRQSGITWAPRDPYYLRWKRRQAQNSPHWFKRTGALENWLRSRTERAYLADFGGVSVSFRKDGKISYKNSGKAVTISGTVGRPEVTAQVGVLSVRYFGKITETMMPGLASFNPRSNPLPGSGILGLLPRNTQAVKLARKSYGRTKNIWKQVGRRVGTKKNGQARWRYRREKVGQETVATSKFRPAIDPFVSFYMTRAIPNAIWRRTERLIRG